jgi:hypothetical protein
VLLALLQKSVQDPQGMRLLAFLHALEESELAWRKQGLHQVPVFGGQQGPQGQ